MGNDRISSISIGLGLDVGQLETDATKAKESLDRLLPKRQERFLTLVPKLDNNAETRIVTEIGHAQAAAQKQLTDHPFKLTPHFTVAKSAVTDMRKSIETQLATTPIKVPIAIGKIKKRDIQADIANAIGTVEIGLSWKWKVKPPTKLEAVVHLTYEGDPPSDLGGTRRGGPRDSGPRGTRGAQTDADRPAGTRAERQAANRAAHAAEREATRQAATEAARTARAEKKAANQATHAAAKPAAQAAPAAEATPAAEARPARQRTSGPLATGAKAPKTKPAQAATPTPQASTAGTAVPPTRPAATPKPQGRPRVSMDELRRGPNVDYNPTPMDLMAEEAEKANGTIIRKPSNKGVRGVGKATPFTRGSPSEIAIGRKALSAEEVAAQEAMWQRHEDIAQHLDKVAAGGVGDPNHEKARQIAVAVRAVRRDPTTGKPDVTKMQEILSGHFGESGNQLGTAYEQMLSGDNDAARETVTETFKNFGIQSGIKKGSRRLAKALTPGKPGFNKQPMHIQMFGMLGNAIRAQAAIDQNPDAVLKKAGRQGRNYGAASVVNNVRVNSDSKGNEALHKRLAEQQPYLPGVRAVNESEAEFRDRMTREAAEGPDEAYAKRNPETGDVGRVLQEEFEDPDRGLVSQYGFVSESDARAEAQQQRETVADRRRAAQRSRAANKNKPQEPRVATPGTEPEKMVIPPPNGAKCPVCDAGPFISESFYVNHYSAMHAVTGGKAGPSTPSAEDREAAKAGVSSGRPRPRPKQNMGAGPIPRYTDEMRAADAEAQANAAKFLGDDILGAKRANARPEPIPLKERAKDRRTRPEKMRDRALDEASSFNEREMALNYLRANRNVGKRSPFTPAHLTLLEEMGHDIKGLAEGGPIRVYKGGRIGGSGDFMRQSYASTGVGYLTKERGYASSYAVDRAAANRGNLDRAYSRGMTHEGSMPASKLASLDEWRKLGGHLGERESAIADLRKRGFAGVDMGMEYEVFDPKYLINHLAGPKGPLPRAEGGHLKKIEKTKFSRPFGISMGAGPNVARANSYEWQKLRRAQIRRQPFCVNCGIGRSEARITNNPLTADHIVSQTEQPDLAMEPSNLQTLCRSCNSSKGHLSGAISNYSKPRRYRKALANGGLYERLHGVALVNERGEEGFESNDGRIKMLLGEKERLFAAPADGKVIPHHKVPEWLRRGQEKMARTGYVAEKALADGGEFKALPDLKFKGAANQPLTERQARQRGWVKGTGEIIRVFVVNFAELGGRMAAAAGHTAAAAAASAQAQPRTTATRTPKTPVGPPAPQMGQQTFGFGGQGRMGPFFQMPPRPARGKAAAAGVAGGPGVGGPPPPNPNAPPNIPPGGAQQQNFGFGNAGPNAGAMPGGGGGGGGGGAAGAKGFKTLSAEQRALADIAATTFYESMRAKLGDIRAETSEQLQLTPVRALSVSVGQIFQTAFGGRGDILARARVANRLASVADKGVSKAEAARTQLDQGRVQLKTLEADPNATQAQKDAQRDVVRDLRTTERLRRGRVRTTTLQANIAAQGEGKVLKELQREQQEQFEQLRRAGKTPSSRRLRENQRRLEEVRTTAAGLRAEGIETGGVATRKNRLQAQALGVAGIVGGTIAFTAAMQLAQVAVQMLSKGFEDATDRLSGFAGTLAKSTEALAPSARNFPGSPRAGISAALAPLGVDVGQFPRLTEFSTRLAGAQDLQQVIDMMRSENRLGTMSRNPNVIPGIGTGFENGPLAGIGLGALGQTPGALEQIAGAVAGTRESPFAAMPGPLGWFGSLATPLTDSLAHMAGLPLTKSPEARAAFSPENAAAAAVGPLTSIPLFGPILGGVEAMWSNNLKAQSDGSEDLTKNLNVLNDRISRTIGDAGKFVTTTQGATQAQLDATAKAYEEAGQGLAGQQLVNAGVAITGPNGALATSDLVNEIGKAATTILPSQKSIMDTMMAPGGLPAQFRAIERQTPFQQKQISINLAQQLMSRPLPPSSTGIIPGAQAGGLSFSDDSFKGVPAGVTESGQKYIEMINTAKADLRGMSQAGDAWLKAKVPPDVIASVSALGEQITSLQSSITDLNTGFQAEQFQHSTDLAKRSLGDALGLAGQGEQTFKAVVGYTDEMVGNTHRLVPVYGEVNAKVTELGRLQRAQLNNSRDQERLNLRIAQRQINFNLAMAQVGVLGASAAERAVSLDDARKRAAEDQQQQDFNKKGFDLGVQIQDIEIDRAVTDQINSLKEQFEGFSLNVETQDVERALPVLQETLQQELGIMDTFKTQGLAFESTLLDAHTALETQSGQFIDTFDVSVQNVLDKINEIKALIAPTPVPGAPVPQPQPLPYIPGDPDRGHATGSWRTGNEVALLHAGEMVIPANQAAWMRGQMLGASMPSSGGGNVTIVNFNNPVVRDDSDLDKLARKVEQVMNQRARAIGVH